MSEYFKNLSKTAKRRYEEKNKDIGVESVEKGDPFLISTVPSKHISNFLRLGENMLPTGGQ